MKKTFLILSGIIFLTVLTSCATPSRCCYSTHYGWQQYVLQSRYGTCIRNHCECVCKACTFNEPACEKCLKCMSYDGCGYN